MINETKKGCEVEELIECEVCGELRHCDDFCTPTNQTCSKCEESQ